MTAQKELARKLLTPYVQRGTVTFYQTEHVLEKVAAALIQAQADGMEEAAKIAEQRITIRMEVGPPGATYSSVADTHKWQEGPVIAHAIRASKPKKVD